MHWIKSNGVGTGRLWRGFFEQAVAVDGETVAGDVTGQRGIAIDRHGAGGGDDRACEVRVAVEREAVGGDRQRQPLGIARDGGAAID